jgi:hypothetical protein
MKSGQGEAESNDTTSLCEAKQSRIPIGHKRQQQQRTLDRHVASFLAMTE